METYSSHEDHIYRDGYSFVGNRHTRFDNDPYPTNEAFIIDFSRIIEHNNAVFGTDFDFVIDEGDNDIELVNSTIHMGAIAPKRDLTYKLTHEAGHGVQMHMFGFSTTHEIIHAASENHVPKTDTAVDPVVGQFMQLIERYVHPGITTATEQGARDWVDRNHLLPPFVIVNPAHQKLIFLYYSSRADHENLARGLRDIHCDALTFKKRHYGYLSPAEQKIPMVRASDKLVSEFVNEIEYTIDQLQEMCRRNEIRVRIDESTPVIIRKIARFGSLCYGIGGLLGRREFLTYAKTIDSLAKRLFGQDGTEYRVFQALTAEYYHYAVACFYPKRDQSHLYSSIHAPDSKLRTGVAKMLGDIKDPSALPQLLAQIASESNPDTRHLELDAVFEIGKNYISKDATWKGFHFIFQYGNEEQKQQLLKFLGTVDYLYFHQVVRLLKPYPQYVTPEIILSFERKRPSSGGIPVEIFDLLKIYNTHHDESGYFKNENNIRHYASKPFPDVMRKETATASLIHEIGKINFSEALYIARQFLHEENQSLRLSGIQAMARLADIDIDMSDVLLLQLTDAFFLPWVICHSDEAFTNEELLKQAAQVYKSHPYIIFETFRAMSYIGKAFDKKYGYLPSTVTAFIKRYDSCRNLYFDLCMTNMLFDLSLSENRFADIAFNRYLERINHSIDYDVSDYHDPYTIQAMKIMYTNVVAKEYVDGNCDPQYLFVRLRQCNSLYETSLYTYIARQNPYLAFELISWALASQKQGHTNEIVPLVTSVLSEIGHEHPQTAYDIMKNLMESTPSRNNKIHLIRSMHHYAHTGSETIPDALRFLKRYISKEDEPVPSVRAAVADSLPAYVNEDPQFVFAALETLTSDSSLSVQRHAIHALIHLDQSYPEQVKRLLKQKIISSANNPHEHVHAIQLLYAVSIHAKHHPNSSMKVLEYMQRIISHVPSHRVITYGVTCIGQILCAAKEAQIHNFDILSDRAYVALRMYCKEEAYAITAAESLIQFASIEQLGPLTNDPSIHTSAKAKIYNYLAHIVHS